MYDFDQMHEILTEMGDSPAGEKIIYARLGMSLARLPQLSADFDDFSR